MNIKKIIGLVLAVLAVGVLIGSAAWQQYQKPSNLFVVRKGDISEEVLATGTVQRGQTIDVTPHVKGRIVAVHVGEGARVKQGATLLEVDVEQKIDTVNDMRKWYAAQQSALAERNNILAQDVRLLAQLKKGVTAVRPPKTPIPTSPQPGLSQADYEKKKNEAESALAQARQEADADLKNAYAPVRDLVSLALLRTSNSVFEYSQEFFSGTQTWLLFPAGNDFRNELAARRAESIAGVQSLQSIYAISAQADHATADRNLVLASGYLVATRDYVERLRIAIDSAQNVASENRAHYKNKLTWARVNLDDVMDQMSARQKTIAAQKKAYDTAVGQAQWYLDFVLKGKPAAPSFLDKIPPPPTPPASAPSLLQEQIRNLERKVVQEKTTIALLAARIKEADVQQKSLSKFGNRIAMYAPADGTVARLSVKVGDMLTPGTPVISVSSGEAVYIQTLIPRAEAGKVSEGNPVSISFDEIRGELFNGHVASRDASSSQEAVQARVILNKDDTRIVQGLSGAVGIVTQTKHDAILLPSDALGESDKGYSVKVYENGVIKDVAITTGIRSREGYVEILSGLSEGQNVVMPKKK